MDNANIVDQVRSKLTARYQTTIPSRVREVLHLHKGEEILYEVRSDGSILLSKDNSEEDKVVSTFLNFLAEDMLKNPAHITAISNSLVSHVSNLVSGVSINLDEELSDDEED